MVLTRPRTSDRFIVTGRTGTGKTTLARAILESMPPPRLLIDPKAAEGTAYAVTFSDPGRLPDAPVARFVPRNPTDLGAYDRLYAEVFAAGPRAVFLDEAPAAAPSNGPPENLVTVIRQGRARGIAHIATSQRPVWIARELLSESEHLIAFPTHYPDDVKILASVMGVEPIELRGAMDRCPKFGFVWYAARDAKVVICPPIKR